MAFSKEVAEDHRRERAMRVLFTSGRFSEVDLSEHYRMSVARVKEILSRKEKSIEYTSAKPCQHCGRALISKRHGGRTSYGLCSLCIEKYLPKNIQGSSRCREAVRIREKFRCAWCKSVWRPGSGERKYDVVPKLGVGLDYKHTRKYLPANQLHLFTIVCHPCNMGTHKNTRRGSQKNKNNRNE